MKEVLRINDSLALTYFKTRKPKAAILMLHGAIENGRIFYPRQNWGLAPFLCQKGYDVYVLDLRGRGQSKPLINKKSSYGQKEAICDDVPQAFEYIQKRSKTKKQIWVAHSWGGVHMASTLARFPEIAKQVVCQVYLGSKRRIQVSNPVKWVMVDLLWASVFKMAASYYGFIPKKFLGIGSDAETKKSHADCCVWIAPDAPWVDVDDGFDYAGHMAQIKFPPTLFIAGQNDACLGHPHDVKLFMKECGGLKSEFHLLSKKNGYQHDYGHIDMLTHSDCYQEHFKMIADWISKAK